MACTCSVMVPPNCGASASNTARGFVATIFPRVTRKYPSRSIGLDPSRSLTAAIESMCVTGTRRPLRVNSSVNDLDASGTMSSMASASTSVVPSLTSLPSDNAISTDLDSPGARLTGAKFHCVMGMPAATSIGPAGTRTVSVPWRPVRPTGMPSTSTRAPVWAVSRWRPSGPSPVTRTVMVARAGGVVEARQRRRPSISDAISSRRSGGTRQRHEPLAMLRAASSSRRASCCL
jgi:hypothetical protein